MAATKPKRKTTRSSSGRLDNLFSWRRAILEATAEEMPSTRAHVMLVLSCHMNDAGDGCWPSQATLALETKLSLRAVQDHLKAAVAAGWLERYAVFDDDYARSGTVYRSAIPAPVWARMAANAERGSIPVPEDEEDAPAAGGGGAPAAPPAESEAEIGLAPPAGPPAGDAGGSSTSCRGVLQEVHPNSSLNSSLNSSEEKKTASPGFSPDSGSERWNRKPPTRPPRALPDPIELAPAEYSSADEELAISVNAACGLAGEASIGQGDWYNWGRLAKLCGGDVPLACKVARLGQERCYGVGNGLRLVYLVSNFRDLSSCVHQDVGAAVAGVDDNRSVIARLKAAGRKGGGS